MANREEEIEAPVKLQHKGSQKITQPISGMLQANLEHGGIRYAGQTTRDMKSTIAC
jgi:hypothetical protein